MAYFDHPTVVEAYTLAINRIGLWRSEDYLFTKLFSQVDTLLDLGCGAGRITFALYAKGYKHIQGVDLSSGMIEAARAVASALNQPVPFAVGDATKLDCPDNAFDGVIFGFNGLMQIPGRVNRRTAMAEILRILRPGACLVFTSHDRALPRYALYWEEETKKWEQGLQDARLIDFGDRLFTSAEGQDGFIHIPTQAELLAELQAVGFIVEGCPLRAELALENDSVREFSDECRFWIVRRPS